MIPPLQTIESQMCSVCKLWGINFLNLSSVSEVLIGETILAQKPQILISSIEKISNPDVQKQLSSLSLEYISVDEAQVNFKEQLKCFYVKANP